MLGEVAETSLHKSRPTNSKPDLTSDASENG